VIRYGFPPEGGDCPQTLELAEERKIHPGIDPAVPRIAGDVQNLGVAGMLVLDPPTLGEQMENALFSARDVHCEEIR
jgi:hypothetical protein